MVFGGRDRSTCGCGAGRGTDEEDDDIRTRFRRGGGRDEDQEEKKKKEIKGERKRKTDELYTVSELCATCTARPDPSVLLFDVSLIDAVSLGPSCLI